MYSVDGSMIFRQNNYSSIKGDLFAKFRGEKEKLYFTK